MAASPIYAATPRCGVNLADDADTIVMLHVAGPNGAILTRVRVQAVGSTAVGVLRIYLNNLSSDYLFMEIPVEAVSAGPDVPAFAAEVILTGGVALPAGWAVKAAASTNNNFNVFAFLSDL